MKIKFNGSLAVPGRSKKSIVLLILILVFSLGGMNVTEVFSQENSEDTSFIEILDEIARHLTQRDFALALELFDSLPPEETLKPPIKIMRASILNSAGRTADARRLANEVIAQDNSNTDALMVLADAAAIDGRDRDRRGFLDRIIGINPNHVRALNDLGNINIRNRNLRIAAGYFDRVLAFEPDNGEALIGRAAVFRYNRELRSAERLLNRVISLYPAWAEPFHERARLYRSAGYLSDALEDLNAALQLEPDNYWAIVDHGLVLMDMNRRQDALESFKRAIMVDPGIFMAYVYSAGLKDEFGDHAGAELDYITLSKLRPDYYFAFEALGIIRMRNENWAGARDAFLDAYRQAPTEFNYAILAAINWMRAGRPADPRQFLTQVLRTAPRDSLDHIMLRLFHELRGDSDVVTRVEREQNIYEKSRMLFYLASYYDIMGSRNLANRFYLQVEELEAFASLEWRLNEIVLEQRGIGSGNPGLRNRGAEQ
ncbi:MAG: tetratricopeptide repeat protein [Treponema sp.]|jgi:tetratricopeptide (TPR) repeat protein|nr:tetratricopeptide repeat protein [Treponema sp.]